MYPDYLSTLDSSQPCPLLKLKECQATDLKPLIITLLNLLPHQSKLAPSLLLNTSVVNMTCAEDVALLRDDRTACVMVAVIGVLVTLAVLGTALDGQNKVHVHVVFSLVFSVSWS